MEHKRPSVCVWGGGGGGWNRWHYSTEWKLRFIQNVASCYVPCLTKESVNTATLIHAPVHVCVCVCVCHARRTEVWVIPVRLKYQVEAGPDWIPSGLWEALTYTITQWSS